MQIRIDIQDHLVARIQAQGLDVQTYVQGILDKMTPQQHLSTQTPEERKDAVEAMMRFAGEHKLTLGGIDLKSTVHEGHKY